MCSGFPFDTVVAELVAFETGLKNASAIASRDVVGSSVTSAAVFRSGVVGHINRITGVVADFLITGLSPGRAYFQIVQPLDAFHEFFLTETPAGGNRREGGIAVVLAEARRTVTTYGKRQQIFVVVCIVQLSEERNQRVTFACTVGLRRAYTGIRPHIVGRKDGKVFFVA